MYSTIKELVDRGNELFIKDNHEGALKFYERAIELDPDDPMIHLKIADTLLMFERYSESYEHALKSLEIDELKERALYRLGKAAYGMRDWIKATHHFEDLRTQFPSNRNATRELTQIRAKMDYEQALIALEKEGPNENILYRLGTAAYNLRDWSSAKAHFEILHSLFPGNMDAVIELLNIKARIDQTSNMKIDFNKLHEERQRFIDDFTDYFGPIEIFPSVGKGYGLRVTRDVRMGTLLLAEKAYAIGPKNDYICTDHPLLLNVLKKARRRPETMRYLKTLYAGEQSEELEFDERMRRVLMMNSMIFYKTTDPNVENRGLWIMASFMNHSCLGNALKKSSGGIITVYAIQDLKAGDEILTRYCEATALYETRMEALRPYGFECNCELCELDKSDGELRLIREKIMRHARTNLPHLDPRTALKTIEDYTFKLKMTYKHRPYPFSLIELYECAYAAHIALGNYHEAAKDLEEAVSIHEKLHLVSPKFYLMIADCYKRMEKREMAEEWIRKAFEYNKLSTGIDDLEYFKKIYPSTAYYD